MFDEIVFPLWSIILNSSPSYSFPEHVPLPAPTPTPISPCSHEDPPLHTPSFEVVVTADSTASPPSDTGSDVAAPVSDPFSPPTSPFGSPSATEHPYVAETEPLPLTTTPPTSSINRLTTPTTIPPTTQSPCPMFKFTGFCLPDS